LVSGSFGEGRTVAWLAVDPTVARLCLAFLDGDKDAVAPLADRLQELGFEGADKVRNHNRNKKLLLVLRALPDATCWQLACDFAEHVLPVWERLSGPEQRLNQAIPTRRRWLEGQAADGDLARANTAAKACARRFRGQTDDCDDMARRAVALAAAWVCTKAPASYAAASAAKHAAAAAREGLLSFEGRAWSREGGGTAEDWANASWLWERRWQINHVREYLTGRIQPGAPEK
jgi:hypothetical protein